MIETQIERINAFCRNLGIPIFKGVINGKKIINWTDGKDEFESLSDFIDFLTLYKPKFLVLNYDSFSSEYITESYDRTLKEIKKSGQKELLKSFEEICNELKGNEDKIFRFEISFVDNGFCFQYHEFAEWAENILEFNKIDKEFKGMELARSRYLISKETLKLARELSKFELFQKATNKAQREIATSIFLRDRILSKSVIYNISSIMEYGDSIGKMNIGKLIDLIETDEG